MTIFKSRPDIRIEFQALLKYTNALENCRTCTKLNVLARFTRRQYAITLSKAIS
ncbi:hypothetical protein D3C78_1952190 [compost metagenome]